MQPVNESSIHSLSKKSKVLWSFDMIRDRQRVNIPSGLNNIVGCRVRYLTWKNSPITDPNTSLLFLISPELASFTAQQSAYSKINPSMPSSFSFNRDTFSRDIIGTFVVCNPISGSPCDIINSNPSIAQPKLDFNKICDVSTIEFEIKADQDNSLVIDEENGIIVTLEFTVLTSFSRQLFI